jgi:hypothetical protein
MRSYVTIDVVAVLSPFFNWRVELAIRMLLMWAGDVSRCFAIGMLGYAADIWIVRLTTDATSIFF